MKNIIQKLANWRAKAGSASGCLLLTIGINAAAQPFASPVGDWDIIESGSRKAVARMTFNSDHTITLAEIVIPKSLVTKGTTAINDSRGTGGNDSRGGSVTNTPLPPHTNIFGFIGFPSGGELNFTNYNDSSQPTGAIWVHDGVPAGQWNFDGSGKLVGFFAEISAPAVITTNFIPFGDPTYHDCTNVVVTDSNGITSLQQLCLTNQPILTNVEYLRVTNAVSFTGKVALNTGDFTKSRITLLATTPGGKATFSGLIPIELNDISGTWFGVMRRQGLPYNEFFTLDPIDFNYYSLDGISPGLGGAGYQFGGTLLVVRQKKFGIYSDVQPSPFPFVEHILHIRAVVGTVDLVHGKLSSQAGLQDSRFSLDSSGSGVDNITYKATLLPPATE